MAGYVPIGAAFGFLGVQSGLPGWFIVLTSMFVYAGASQFMMIPMAVAGLSIPVIALATFVVNLRHAFYGISLLDRLDAGKIKRWYCVFALTDETFSLVTTLPKTVSADRIFALSFLNQLWWIVGTLLGVCIGLQAQIALSGMDFVLCCLFAMLATEQWRCRKTSWSLWCALIAYPIAWFFFEKQALLVSIALCAVAGFLWGQRKEKSGETDV